MTADAARTTLPTLALFLAGAVACAPLGNDRITPWWRWVVVAAIVGVALVPPVRRALVNVARRAREPSARVAEWTTIAVFVVATAYLVFAAFRQERDLLPKTHDEGSYLLGIRMLAAGRLWMPPHELADFFDTFYVLVRPVYASIYFPGTALMHAPGVWLGWPTWGVPVVAAGAAVALLYRVTADLTGDALLGLGAALLLVSVSEFRMLSMLLFSHLPMLLLGLLCVWAWLRWRRAAPARRWAWALAIGAFAGWAAITRPVDALCYALPVGLAMLFDLRGRPARAWALSLGLLVAGAAPFLALQGVFNVGVTGRVLETPYTYYLAREQPNTTYGFRRDDPAAAPASAVRQKRDYYDSFMRPFIRRHRPGQVARTWATTYAPMVVDSTLPSRALLPLAFAGVLALIADRRRLVLAAVLPLLLLLYVPNPFFLEHYAVPAAPAVILLTVLGTRHVVQTVPPARAREWAGVALAAAVTGLAITALPEVNPRANDEPFHSSMLAQLPIVLDGVSKPAVVLFRYAPGDPVVEEPVYNNTTAWPDDAPVIRAHDLGPRNVEIFRYYAQRQPERTFYRFDRRSRTLELLGPASDLAAQAEKP